MVPKIKAVQEHPLVREKLPRAEPVQNATCHPTQARRYTIHPPSLSLRP